MTKILKILTQEQKAEANRNYHLKIDYYTDLLKKGMKQKEAWDKATAEYGHPLQIYDDAM